MFFVLGASFALKPICAGHGSAASFCYRLRETGGGAGALFLLFTPTHTHTPIHEDEAKIVGAETRARVCVRELYSRSTRYVELGERGGICRCFYGGAGLHPGGICFTPTLRQLEGPVAEATDLNFKPIYK